MSEEQINIAIAIACGWKRPDHPDVMKFKQGWSMPEKWWMCPNGVLRFKHDIPDYCNDLHAMHEALELMIRQQYKESNFWFFLREIIGFPEAESDWDENYFFAAVNATARQRAEAFLRTIGKWEEGAK